ncbi:hypothetical protein CDA63_11965 [Hymenobacter amundsenii]|uniref:Integrase catalytic domain-containing protein n=1 Tax=Hymenobacter amundsenii TaxID=2006685 RepID=A0A246FK42_9BACT|nr:integrase core domain-containing protein [Hymenobacter amundsenii]OWP62927.1 hypothetical protein CDA63_11965 [Hymenobacter amundsenii]
MAVLDTLFKYRAYPDSAAGRARIEQAGALSSFSRLGNLYNKAQAEAGWTTLKTESLPQGENFANLEEARLEVAYHLDIYFNLDRRHSALGYRSPINLNATRNSTWLSALSVFTGPPQFFI